jgi:hypothetical protein
VADEDPTADDAVEAVVSAAVDAAVLSAADDAAVTATPASAAETGCAEPRTAPPPRAVAAINNEAKIHFLPSLYMRYLVFFAFRLRFMLINLIKVHTPLLSK